MHNNLHCTITDERKIRNIFNGKQLGDFISTFWYINSTRDYTVIKKIITKSMQKNGEKKSSCNNVKWKKQKTMLHAPSQ